MGKYSRIHRGIYSTRYDIKKANADAEKLITLAKRGDLHARRLAASQIRQDDAVKKLFSRRPGVMRAMRSASSTIGVVG